MFRFSVHCLNYCLPPIPFARPHNYVDADRVRSFVRFALVATCFSAPIPFCQNCNPFAYFSSILQYHVGFSRLGAQNKGSRLSIQSPCICTWDPTAALSSLPYTIHSLSVKKIGRLRFVARGLDCKTGVRRGTLGRIGSPRREGARSGRHLKRPPGGGPDGPGCQSSSSCRRTRRSAVPVASG